MTNELNERLSTIESNMQTLRTAMDPAAAASYIASQLTEFTAQFDFAGVNVAPPAAVAEADRKLRAKYDDDLRSAAATFEEDLAALERDLQTLETTAREVADPVEEHASQTNRLLARHVQLLEQEQAERQLRGTSLRELAATYAAAPDGELRRVIERSASQGFHGIELRHEHDDAESLLTLRAAIEAQRTARIAARLPELAAQRGRVQALKGSATSSALRRHLATGGRVAAGAR
jgi:hypothetical protein